MAGISNTGYSNEEYLQDINDIISSDLQPGMYY